MRASLVKYGYFLQEHQIIALPKSFSDWQIHVLKWLSWYLSYNQATHQLKYRVRDWDTMAIPWLRGLVDEGVLPEGLALPRAKLKREIGRPRGPRNPELMGDTGAKPTQEPVNKTIAGPIFWRSDLDYLDEIERTLHGRNELVRKVTDDYWLRLVKDYRSGKNLARRIDSKKFAKRYDMKDWSVRGWRAAAQGPKYVTSCGAPDGAAWALKVLEKELATGRTRDVFVGKRLEDNVGLQTRFLTRTNATPVNELDDLTALTANQAAFLDIRQIFMRFLGVLTTLDAAVARLILIQEHPNLSPWSIANADLLNARGKTQVQFGGEGNKLIFSVDKPRAGKRKYAVLSPRAARVVKHVIRATQDVRRALKLAGYEHWRRLFVGCPGGRNPRIGILTVTSANLTSANTTSLIRFYPDLEAGGLVSGVFDFKKLRTTQGAIEWFETGSIQAASRKLGNTYRTALNHYVPEPLVRLWNERLVRRFQNTMILLATSSEDYMLDVTDIGSIEELHSFVVQVIDENPKGSSPLADRIHLDFARLLKLDGGPETERHDQSESDLLSVRLDANSLALLYAYREKALELLRPRERRRPSPGTGVSPDSMIQLAQLLSSACDRDSVSEVMAESLELSQLKQINSKALVKLPNILKRFENLHISQTWGQS